MFLSLGATGAAVVSRTSLLRANVRSRLVPHPSYQQLHHHQYHQQRQEQPRRSDHSQLPDVTTATVSAALVGAPNAGKSSLSNALACNRISAVSRKVNTTQHRLTAVHTAGARQLELWDTPGVLERAFATSTRRVAPWASSSMRREVAADAWGAAADADVVVLVVDASRSPATWRHVANVAKQLIKVRQSRSSGSSSNIEASDLVEHTETEIEGQTRFSPLSSSTAPLKPLKLLERDGRPRRQLLVLNKEDMARPRTRLLEAADFFQSAIPEFKEHFGTPLMTSARTGRGINDLREELLSAATPAPFEFEPDEKHGEDDVSLMRQHVWEKLLHTVHDEVPYRCKFKTDRTTQLDDGSMHFSETIIAPTKGAVSMVIGPKGRNIEWIREQAQLSLKEVLGCDVKLTLRVTLAK